MSNFPTVIITQSGDRGRALTERLIDCGVQAIHYPLIRTEPIDAAEWARQLQALPDSFSAWIFTSVTAARSWLDAMSAWPEWMAERRVCYCIGETTAHVLRDAGHPVVVFAGVKEAADLVQAIGRVHSNGEDVFVFVRGRQASLAVTTGLRALHFTVCELVVYDTKSEWISSRYPLVNEWDRSIWVLFSPSGVDSLLQANRDFARLVETGHAQVVAFGRTTARALAERGIAIAAVPMAVTHDALIHTIRCLIEDTSQSGGDRYEL